MAEHHDIGLLWSVLGTFLVFTIQLRESISCNHFGDDLAKELGRNRVCSW